MSTTHLPVFASRKVFWTHDAGSGGVPGPARPLCHAQRLAGRDDVGLVTSGRMADSLADTTRSRPLSKEPNMPLTWGGADRKMPQRGARQQNVSLLLAWG